MLRDVAVPQSTAFTAEGSCICPTPVLGGGGPFAPHFTWVDEQLPDLNWLRTARSSARARAWLPLTYSLLWLRPRGHG